MEHLDSVALDDGLGAIRAAPTDTGTLELIVARPTAGERQILEVATIDTELGLIGDNWRERGSRHTPDGSPEPERQLNVMSVRAAELVAQGLERVPLAGDQLFLDLDLSVANLPTGSLLAIGDVAVIEVTPPPHTGCAKFTQRFGLDAMRFVNSPVGKELRLRGLCARVVAPGVIRSGDAVVVTRP